ncbi:MAG: helix-turn-helix domain-containing protein [Dehalococcoidia bacterium]|nr:helix-turn-helix domain-containing protein [Dehalococcoidia bacterium]
MDRKNLITIGEASHLIGVNEATLRQWTDKGQVKAFITPGGHRRYSRREIANLTGIRRHGISEMLELMKNTPLAHHRIADEKLSQTSWYKKLDTDSRRQMGRYGRNVLSLAIAYISKPQNQESTMELAREMGREMGKNLVTSGLSLSESLEAFLLHRAPVTNVISEFSKGGGTMSNGIARAIPQVNHLLDEILLAMVQTYQEHKDRTASEK